MPRYLVYRHGSNAANQSMRDTAPVAIVEAKSANEACAVESDPKPTIHSSAWLALNSDVTLYANQRVSAVPLSKARKADRREVEERPSNDSY